MDAHRSPCPLCIPEDCGAAFAMGVIGGSVYHSLKGYMDAPSGIRNRIRGSFTTAIVNAPKTGGRFSVWGVTFSAVHCALVAKRKKDDPWNSIVSGMVTGAVLAARSGVPVMVGNAIVGGILMAMIEGAGIVVNKIANEEFPIAHPGNPSETDHVSFR